jgi:hypothetical protein
MKKRDVLLAFAIGLQFLLFGGGNVFADEFCVAGVVLYKLQTGFPDDASVVNGIRLSSSHTTIAGTLFTADDGTVNIGFTEHFNWGSGNWTDPAGVTVLKFPPAGDATYDTTYYGASNPPRAFRGTATVVACPSQPRAPVGDPNWIPQVDRQVPFGATRRRRRPQQQPTTMSLNWLVGTHHGVSREQLQVTP